ncbi:MAG: hypothetical protein R3B54_03925 [Bdellovibrionota bacterium]
MNGQLQLISKLHDSSSFWKAVGGEAADADQSLIRFSDFVRAHEDCFHRTLWRDTLPDQPWW